MAKEKKAKWYWFVIIILGAVLLFSFYTGGNNGLEKDYYKDQMLNFCDIAQAQYEIIEYYDDTLLDNSSVNFYDCNIWLLD